MSSLGKGHFSRDLRKHRSELCRFLEKIPGREATRAKALSLRCMGEYPGASMTSGKETGSRERAGPAQSSHGSGPPPASDCSRRQAPGAHLLFLSYFCASADMDAGERPFYQLVS